MLRIPVEAEESVSKKWVARDDAVEIRREFLGFDQALATSVRASHEIRSRFSIVKLAGNKFAGNRRDVCTADQPIQLRRRVIQRPCAVEERVRADSLMPRIGDDGRKAGADFRLQRRRIDKAEKDRRVVETPGEASVPDHEKSPVPIRR